MKSSWFVSTNIVAGQKMYQVVRLRDANAPDHSGNRESEGMFTTKEKAQTLADKLNRDSMEV